jgi:hypothetical protein
MYVKYYEIERYGFKYMTGGAFVAPAERIFLNNEQS